jgi:hypothetical protein
MQTWPHDGRHVLGGGQTGGRGGARVDGVVLCGLIGEHLVPEHHDGSTAMAVVACALVQ